MGIEIYACNPLNWEVEKDGLGIQVQHWLHKNVRLFCAKCDPVSDQENHRRYLGDIG